MKRLIVNADDLGADEGRNAGIFEAMEAGVVTAASILANGPALDDAVSGIRGLGRKNVSFGIHVNLSEGAPLSRGLRLLTPGAACFPGKVGSRELLMSYTRELEDEIAREIRAQISELKKRGIALTHIDGHQHVHVFPAVLRCAVSAAVEYSIPWMRIPDEPIVLQADIGADLLREAEGFREAGRRARPLLKGTGLRSADHFRGLLLKGRPSALAETVRHLPEGLAELMVHPGRVMGGAESPFSAFSNEDRVRELEALLSGTFRRTLEENVTLCCFTGTNS
ncbi:MAG TPA: ChbG/HpnK family deacetylase [Thermodesulfobacteriota bacterium]|nr:ChbG/HpnK family deacetylase [Thermodesulfobacteriota bacterium]